MPALAWSTKSRFNKASLASRSSTYVVSVLAYLNIKKGPLSKSKAAMKIDPKTAPRRQNSSDVM